MHEITLVRRQGREGVYAGDRRWKYLCLSLDIPSEYLLPRRGEYTRVYTSAL